MDHGLEVIPISSYRRASTRRRPLTVAAPPAAVAEAPQGVRVGLALATGAGLLLVLIVALVGFSQAQTVGSIRELPAAERTAIYARALTDTEAACTMPDARTGALGEHCLSQAQFLALFPECDGRCQRIVASILPHAHR